MVPPEANVNGVVVVSVLFRALNDIIYVYAMDEYVAEATRNGPSVLERLISYSPASSTVSVRSVWEMRGGKPFEFSFDSTRNVCGHRFCSSRRADGVER